MSTSPTPTSKNLDPVPFCLIVPLMRVADKLGTSADYGRLDNAGPAYADKLPGWLASIDAELAARRDDGLPSQPDAAWVEELLLGREARERPMGSGRVGVLMFGFALADDRADVVYGLLERYNGGAGSSVRLPGEEAKPAPDWHRFGVETPMHGVLGRFWAGAKLASLPPLPPKLEDKVRPADSPENEGMVDLPRIDPAKRSQAVDVVATFAAWCERRGVDLGKPGLFVVADYD